MKKIKYFALFGIIALGVSGCSCSPRTNEPVVLSKISLSGDYKTDFYSTDNFTYEGLIVTASYSDSSTKEVLDYKVSTPDMTVYTPQTVTVTYSEADITKTATYTITVTDVADLPTLIENALKELRVVFNNMDMENYSKPRWNKIIACFNKAVSDIKLASSKEQIDSLKAKAINELNTAPTTSEIVAGTYFDTKSSSSNYEFDRDENNNLVISYDGYPGHWVHVGTNNLKVNLEKENIFTLTLHNDISEQIEVCLQLMKNSDKVADSGIKKIAGNSQLEIRLDFDTEITKLYLFLDSCSEHNRVGQVTIKEAKFGYESHEITTVFDPVTVNINKAFDKDTNHAKYTLTADEHPRYIRRVDVMGKVDYHGNGNSKQYFGITVSAGSSSVTLNDAAVHTQTNDTGINFIANLPIDSSKKLSTGAEVSTAVQYCAEGLTFEVTKYIFYYTLWNPLVNETVDVNTLIWDLNVGEKGTGYEATIPYSSFTKTGRVDHIDVEFSYENADSYGKSQIYFRGFDFTNFSSGNNNVLNIGSFMGKAKDGVPAVGTGSVSLYPTKNIDLKTSSSFIITCWWSCATTITLNSITIYSDLEDVPSSVTGLDAHPIDKGVVLNWNAASGATTYEVYKDNTLVDTVRSTFITIDGLTNGTEYTFGVKAKNSVGTSEMTTIKATPVEGATYDTFIEGLNTTLEETIGQEGVNGILETSSQYRELANNARLKNAINKLKNGEETTAVFVGGSITVGEGSTLKDEERHHPMGYAYYTYQWLKNNFDAHDKLRYVNASISGTGSHIGIVRAEKDVLQYKPDIVFIEFAANNNTTEFNNATYESLIRKCQALDNDPAIVLVFSATYYTGHTEEVMSKIGKHYSLPMYTIDKGLRTVCTPDKNRSDPIYKLYSADGTHPSDDGHKLMAKGLCYFIRGLLNKDADVKNVYPSDPSQSGYNDYDTLKSVDHTTNKTVIKSLGSFEAANTATNSTKNQSDVTAFQQGWKKTDTSVNDAMVIEMNAKNFILIYEAGNPSVSGDPEGNIIVTYTNIDDPNDTGSLTWDLSYVAKQGNSGSTAITDQEGKGWNNPVGILIFNKAVSANYRVTIKMNDNSGICSIMAFGYSI